MERESVWQERPRSRRGRRASMPASERPIAAQTYLKPWLLDWVREEALRRDQSIASLIGDAVEALYRAGRQEEETPVRSETT